MRRARRRLYLGLFVIAAAALVLALGRTIADGLLFIAHRGYRRSTPGTA